MVDALLAVLSILADYPYVQVLDIAIRGRGPRIITMYVIGGFDGVLKYSSASEKEARIQDYPGAGIPLYNLRISII